MKIAIIIVIAFFVLIMPMLKISHEDNLAIPSMIRDNVKLWAHGQVDDSYFAGGLQYLIDQKIMKTSSSNSYSSNVIPNWVKNNAKWWSDGLLDDSEFVNGMQYLIQSRIIHLNYQQQDTLQRYQQIAESRSNSQTTNTSTQTSITTTQDTTSAQTTTALHVDLISQSTVPLGGTQYLTAFVTDGTNPVRGATVSFAVNYASSTTTKHFHCTTDSSGKYSYSWMIPSNAATGTFVVHLVAEKVGYNSGQGDFPFKVIPIS